jgi:Flp pilus assembly protein TadG
MASQSHQGDRWGLHTLLRRKRGSGTRGQALVEFAFTLPLLLMLLIGIIESGILLNNWVILTDAVRSGARELAISRAPGVDACTRAANRVQAAAIGLTAGSIVVTSTVVASCTSLTAGSDATLNATYPCDLSILGIDYAPGCNLRSTSTVRIE